MDDGARRGSGPVPPTYPYSRSGKMAGGAEDFPSPDPLIWLAFAGGGDDQRSASLPASSSSRSATRLSSQRRWRRSIVSAAGAPLSASGWAGSKRSSAHSVLHSRGGERTDEYVAVMRALWTQEAHRSRAPTVAFTDVYLRPQPIQRPVPIVIGGHSERAKRAGMIGDGFFPAGVGSSDSATGRLGGNGAERSGRDGAALEVTMGAKPTPESVAAVVAAGVDRLLLPAPQDPDDLDRMASAVGVASRLTPRGEPVCGLIPSVPEDRSVSGAVTRTARTVPSGEAMIRPFATLALARHRLLSRSIDDHRARPRRRGRDSDSSPDASFALHPGDKVGLVGQNGAGKTTLLHWRDCAIRHRATSPGRVASATWSQEAALPELEHRDDGTRARLAALVGGVQRRMEETRHRMEGVDGEERDRLIRKFARLEEEFQVAGGYRAEAEARKFGAAVGITDEEMAQPVRTMSGGNGAGWNSPGSSSPRPKSCSSTSRPTTWISMPKPGWSGSSASTAVPCWW